jgi:4-amino-4-deoxy-L-arabinose transferase-like glycosyltransferase
MRSLRIALCALLLLPLVALALYPPIAFDETLYHLPFVQAIARDGAIRWHPDLRFPVFPILHELLCVPPFLLGGGSATHFVALLESILLAALLIRWGNRYAPHAGWLAAALFLGSPLVVHLATILYVDIALALCVAAGFYALDRERYALAGFAFGAACSVKYLGFYFAAAALVIVIVRRRSAIAPFAAAGAVTALPTTLWIWLQTGDPFFPFVKPSAWTLPAGPPMPWTERLTRIATLVWDVTFARDRAGFEPPVTPLLALLVALTIAAAVRDARARWIAGLSAVYAVIFTFLPADARYLVPLLPLLCLIAAIVVARRWPRATVLLAVLAIAPGIAYAGYRLMRQGLPPLTSSQRESWLAARVPEYRALRRAGTERVYACYGEHLKAYAAGPLLGDHAGPWSYNRILTGAGATSTLAARLRPLGVRYYLLRKRSCPPPRIDGGMELVYEDANAQMWRVQ